MKQKVNPVHLLPKEKYNNNNNNKKNNRFTNRLYGRPVVIMVVWINWIWKKLRFYPRNFLTGQGPRKRTQHIENRF